MTHIRSSTRRTFLKQAAALAAPAFLRDLRAAPPSEVVRHASFGAAGQARSDINDFASHPRFKLVCFAEVDLARIVQIKQRFPEARVYQDWRKMLDEERANLDSVNVSTPDHMHAVMSMSAMQLGLHVYVQKPLTHDIYESRRLTQIAAEKKLVTQMGIQQHSCTEYLLAAQLIQSGAIGKVREVHAWSFKTWGDPAPRPDRSDTPPGTLDWDLWLGVAESRPFIGG
jgi:predicted dehydrogenase